MKRNLTIRKPFGGGRSLFGPGLIRTKRQRRVASMVRKRRSAGMITDAEYKRLSKSARGARPGKKKLEGLFHELYGRNPMKKARRKKKNRSRKGVMPPALRKYWAKKRAKKSNPKRKRKANRRTRRANRPRVVTRTRTVYKTRKVYVNPKRRRNGTSLTTKLLKLRRGAKVELSKSEAKIAKRLFGKRLRAK